jgi:hypothetical protein
VASSLSQSSRSADSEDRRQSMAPHVAYLQRHGCPRAESRDRESRMTPSLDRRSLLLRRRLWRAVVHSAKSVSMLPSSPSHFCRRTNAKESMSCYCWGGERFIGGRQKNVVRQGVVKGRRLWLVAVSCCRYWRGGEGGAASG